MNNVLETCNRFCSGCGLCASICPVQAIKMELREEVSVQLSIMTVFPAASVSGFVLIFYQTSVTMRNFSIIIGGTV